MKDDMSNEKVKDLMTNQKLLSNKDLMIKNLDNLINNLNECEDYIQDVIDNKIRPDQSVAKSLNACISQFSSDDMQVLENMVMENFEDAVMINSLAKLQHAHISMTEKLNNIFA